jgi:tetratricopeptide (TPR) repeat protein
MRFTVRVGIGVLLVCGALSIAQVAADRVASITSALRAGQFDAALELLGPELQKNPKSAQLWTLDGIALSGKAEKKQGLAAFRRALDVSPNYLPALEGAAQIEYEAGGRDAVALLERVLVLQPGEQTSHAMLAVLEYRGSNCRGAIPHFEKSGALLDSQPGALVAYGDCLVQAKEIEKAITVFSRALAQSNDDANIRCRLAAAQVMASHPKDAIATLQPLLNRAAKNADVLELAASAYEADGDTPEAVRILREAIISDPHNVNLYVDFANISLDHQSFQVGVDMINAGLQAEPKAAALYVARGILFVQLAQYDNAEADFEKANTIDPRQSLGSAAEGLAAVQQNDPVQALATVRAKLAKKPNDPFLLYLKAETLTQKGPDPGTAEFREAMDSAKKAVALQPSLGAAHDILAKLYLQRGNNELAAEQSRIALKTDPNDQTALYHLIQALRKSGRNSEVPELLKRLAELRSEATKEEAEHNRFKLVEDKSASSEKPQP